jgi:hypothetical protein
MGSDVTSDCRKYGCYISFIYGRFFGDLDIIEYILCSGFEVTLRKLWSAVKA